MSTDPNIWINTLPVKKIKHNEKEFELDGNIWINTISKKK